MATSKRLRFLSLGLVLVFVGVMSVFYARVRNGRAPAVLKPEAAVLPAPAGAAGAYPVQAAGS